MSAPGGSIVGGGLPIVAYRGGVATIDQAAREVSYFDDFISSTSTSGDQVWHSAINGAGSGQSANSSVLAGSVGRRTITSGTAVTGRAHFTRSELVAGQASLVTPWLSGRVELVWRIQIPQLPAAGSEPSWSLALGAGAASASLGWTEGIGARYSLAEGFWTLASRVASADVAVQASAIAPAAGAWQVIVLTIAGAAAQLWIGDTLAQARARGPVATVTTAGASTAAVAQLFKMHNTAAVASARSLHVDFAGLVYTMAASR